MKEKLRTSLFFYTQPLPIRDKDRDILQKRKIWVDLENSPHVLFFHPIIKELKKRNYDIVITARDYAQVFELADLFGLDYVKIGAHFGRNKIMKVIGLFSRSLSLLSFIRSEKPTLSFSHGSRTQLLASKICGLPCVIAGDYEYGQKLPFIQADMYLVPEILFAQKNQMQPSRQVLGYPGIKENVYVPEFVPDYRSLSRLGIDDGSIIATIRPPATEAHYHRHESSLLFNAIVQYLCKSKEIRIVMVPRTSKQKEKLKGIFSQHLKNGKIIIPEQVVNGLDLVYFSDMVLSGGGTMIREAAALNVPSYSFFRGKIGAVDNYLAQIGRLTLIEKPADIPTKIRIIHRSKVNYTKMMVNTSLESIINHIETLMT